MVQFSCHTVTRRVREPYALYSCVDVTDAVQDRGRGDRAGKITPEPAPDCEDLSR